MIRLYAILHSRSTWRCIPLNYYDTTQATIAQLRKQSKLEVAIENQATIKKMDEDQNDWL